jgi:hypothetical protein
MNKRIVLLLSAAMFSGSAVFAQPPPGAGQIDVSVPTTATQSALPSSTTLSMRGTIDKYDASSRTLSLSTSSGTVQFPVLSTTRIRQGWHKVDALDLQKLTGERATVRYTESGGDRIVESVHVFGK